MPDPIARRRLKKKMLDRWENEGGRIVVAPTGADDPGPTSENEGEGKQPLRSRDNSKIDHPASLAKRRKPTRK